MIRRVTPALAAATLLLAACGSAGPAISDPREIMTQGLEATAELQSFHLDLELDGSVTVADLGGEMSLTGTTLGGDLDLENQEAHFTFAIPSLLGLSGEVIQIGQDSYVKTSMTGDLWAHSTSAADDPVSEAMDPDQVLDQVRDFLDEEGVELQKMDDADCGDGTCYALRLTIPGALLAESTEGAELDASEFVGDELVLDLLFDRENLWLTEVSTDLGGESVGELTVTLTLSEFDEDVSVEAPPEDQVTEDGGEIFPF